MREEDPRMKKFVSLVSLLLTMLFLSGFQATSTKGSFLGKSTTACSGQDCSDAWGGCKQKVEFVGRDGDCATFRCQKGTKNEHVIKTNDQNGIKALLKLAEEPKEKVNADQ